MSNNIRLLKLTLAFSWMVGFLTLLWAALKKSSPHDYNKIDQNILNLSKGACAKI